MELLSKEVIEATKKKFDKELEIYDFVGDKEQVSHYGIDKIPAVIISGERDFGIRLFGVPKTIFNEDVSLDGAVPDNQFLESLLKAAGSESSEKE